MHDEFDDVVKKSIGEEAFKKIMGPDVNIHWDKNDHGVKAKTLNNVVAFFKTDKSLIDLIKLNMFTWEIEFTRAPLWRKDSVAGEIIHDNDIIAIKGYLSSSHTFDVPVSLIFEAIVLVASQSAYHPIKTYLEAIKWDGVKRLDTWLVTYAGCQDTAYTQAVSAKILLAAISRIYQPGCKFDYMLILEGDQGIGKSTLVSALGGAWYKELDLFSERNKDTVDAMRGVWIAEVSELANFKKAEIEGVKAFISKQIDRVRLSYDRCTKNFHRQIVFIGTINPDGNGYLRDQTGNRRFWPVACRKVDCHGLVGVRDQLFAEAYLRYKEGGFKLYLEGGEMEIAVLEQKEREVKETWTYTIGEWLDKSPLVTQYHYMDIALGALELEPAKVGKWEEIRIGSAMRELGWERKVIRVGVKLIRKWVKKEDEPSLNLNKPGWED